MTFLTCNDGELVLLQAMVGKVAPGTLVLRLFTSNTTPADTDTAATYTEMGAVQGYAAKNLTTSGWNAGTAGTGTGTSSSNAAAITYPQQTFTFDGTGGTQTVNGYFITDSATGKLIGAERFGSAQTVANAGDSIKITPQLTLSHS